MVLQISTAKSVADALNYMCLKAADDLDYISEVDVHEIAETLIGFIKELLTTKICPDIQRIARYQFSINPSISNDIITKWTQQPDTFISILPPKIDIACSLYTAISKADDQPEVLSTIRRRLCLVQFYFLKQQYKEDFISGRCEPLANHLFLCGIDDLETLKKNCADFGTRGKRLLELTEIEDHKHPGTLLLTTELGQSRLERRMNINDIKHSLGRYEFIDEETLAQYDHAAREVQAVLNLRWTSWLAKLKEKAQQCIAFMANDMPGVYQTLSHQDLQDTQFPYPIRAPVSILGYRPCDEPLTPGALSLAQTMFFMGASVPYHTLLSASSVRFWGDNGEISPLTTELLDIVCTHTRLIATINELYNKGFLAAHQFEDNTTEYTVNMKHEDIGDPSRWKAEAVRLVAFTFPASMSTEPLLFHKKAKAMLPSLHHVTIFLQDQGVREHAYHVRIIEACLAATYFSTMASKKYFLNLARILSYDNLELSARVHARAIALSQLYPSECVPFSEESLSDIASIFKRDTARSNALYGEIILQMAHHAIKLDNPTTVIINILEQFRPLEGKPISAYEAIINNEKTFLIGKSWRYQGNFAIAEKELGKIFQATKYRITEMLPHFCEVLCETGNAGKALWILGEEMKSGPIRRIKIAHANALLFSALQSHDRSYLQTAYEEFQHILASYQSSHPSQAHQFNVYTTLAAIALIEHVQGLQSAYESWENARKAIRACSMNEGYSEMITVYAQSEITLREGRGDQGELRSVAFRLWSKVGARKFFNAGAGTIWPDIIGNLMETSGQERLIPIDTSAPVQISLSRELFVLN